MQININIERQIIESINKQTPSKWRLVDNREAYIKKRMAMEGLK